MRKAITGFSISNDCRVGRRQMTALGAAVVFFLAAVLFAAGAASGQQLHHWTNRPAQIPTHQWGFRAPIHMNTWRFPRLTRAAIGERPPVEWTDLPTAEQLRERLDLLGLSESQKERVDRLWNNYQYVNYIDQQRRREEIARVHQQISRARRFDKWYRERQLWQYLNVLQRGERQGWDIFADQLLDILTYDQ